MYNVARALAVLDPSLTGSAPDWVELLPMGPFIKGVDGREWQLTDPATVVAAFDARHLPLAVDWEHATEHRAPVGLDAPAAGWIDQLEARNGAIWGHVAWTEKAAAQIAAREYRFLSPVFTYRTDDRSIAELTSVGLTNSPNLRMTALNRAQESVMTLPTAVCAALSLPPESDESVALAAITALKQDVTAAKNRAETPALDRFIPRADYDAALSRAANAEARIADIEKARKTQVIDALIEKALQARQISPATKDFYVAACQQEGGIEQFTAFLGKAPALIGSESGLGNKKPGPTAPALNSELQHVAALFGNSLEDLQKFGGVQ